MESQPQNPEFRNTENSHPCFCSMKACRSQPSDSPFLWEIGQASFPTEVMNPQVGISLSTLNSNDTINLSIVNP